MLARFFSKRHRQRPSGPANSRAYAIGDVHGRLDLMLELLRKIEADNRARRPAKTYLIFLGDLVDRGPDSRGVLDELVARPPRFDRTIFLKGNHEEFFLNVINGDEGVVRHWLTYGGTECAESYGVTSGWMLNAAPGEILEALVRQVPRSHVDFISDMADSFRFGDYLFVHAGIRPGIALEQQVSKDLRWIREGFLDDLTDHGVMVVHGHTIVDRPEEHRNRIAVDTGAYRSGTLTALAIEGTERWFLEAKSEPLPVA